MNKTTLVALATGVAAIAAVAIFSNGKTTAEERLRKDLPEIFARAAKHYKALDAAATPLVDKGPKTGVKQIPHGYIAKTGKLDMRDLDWWTTGHFPGSLWYLYEATNDETLKDRAVWWTELLEPNKNITFHHDTGFMMYCSFGNARRILDTDKYDDILLTTAKSLATRYSDKLGLLRSWGDVKDNKHFLVIPDNMMNLELLEWAAENGFPKGDEIARSHATQTMKHHFRPDGGTFHVLDYTQDFDKGQTDEKYRVQGIRREQGASCETAWARGQAWAIYGYTMMYRFTKDSEYLSFAQKLADYAINNPNMPADGVPYWDFGAKNELRDSSAAAVIDSALLELYKYVAPEKGKKYREFAVRSLLTLSSPEYFSEDDEIGHWLLKHGVGSIPYGSEVDTPLDYGDYYYLEALLRFRDSEPVASSGAFAYIIGLGASVMMPVIFTILGILIGIKFTKALKSGLLVGIGFVGLGVVTALLTSNLGPALKGMTELYSLNLPYFDLGWPAAAAVAYSCAVGAFIIPVCLGVNVAMLFTGTTRTVNIDLWNYWHFAFLGAMVFFFTGSLAWAFYAAVILYIITLCMADFTAKGFQKYYDGMEGISIPQPFCQSFTPFAVAIGWLLDRIPGFSRLNIDAEGMKRKFGLLGEPLFLGLVIGCAIGCLRCDSFTAVVDSVPSILKLGVTVGAVMELIPRITALFIEGLKPISEATRKMVEGRFSGLKGLSIGMSPALVIGHPTTLVVSILLIPVILFLSVFLPGNKFLPLASLAGMFYLFPCVLPITKGNVLKTFIVGLVALVAGLYFVTNLTPSFSKAIAAAQLDGISVPAGFEGGAALDFASALWCWIVYHLTVSLKWIGAVAAGLLALAMCTVNFIRIRRLSARKDAD